jgi:hypothetical protein
VPENEDPFCFEGVFCFDDVLFEVLAVVVDFGPEVVNKEWVGETVFIVSEGHGLEVQGHLGSTLDISELVSAGGGVAVHVEEFGGGSLVLGEVGVVSALVPLLIVVNHVVGLRGEEGIQLFVLEDLIENPDFVHGGLSTSVSDSSESDSGEEGQVDFPDQGLVEHEEAEGGVCYQSPGPSVVRSVCSGADLVKVISSSESPFPEVVLEQVVAVLEFVGVSFSLGLLVTAGSVDVCPVVDINVIKPLGWLEPEVVVAWGGGSSEVSEWHLGQSSGLVGA